MYVILMPKLNWLIILIITLRKYFLKAVVHETFKINDKTEEIDCSRLWNFVLKLINNQASKAR